MEVCTVASQPTPTADTEGCRHGHQLRGQSSSLPSATERIINPGCLLCLCWIGCDDFCCVWWDRWGIGGADDQIRPSASTMSSLNEVQELFDKLNKEETILSLASLQRCMCTVSMAAGRLDWPSHPVTPSWWQREITSQQWKDLIIFLVIDNGWWGDFELFKWTKSKFMTS